MLRHVNLLAILWSVWGALAVLVGISMLLLGGGALAPVIEPGSENIALAAGLTAALFALTGAVGVLWGGAHIWAGLLLRRRHPFGRILSLALAMVNLVVLPFGTALGIYALWVLLTNDGRKLFEPHPLSPVAPR